MSRLYSAGLPVEVQADEQGAPVCFTLGGRNFTVTGIADQWRIDEEWWGVRAVRVYYKVLVDGAAVLLYRQGTGWFIQRMYD